MKTLNIPMTEKRLLSVAEFQVYASVGRNNAFKLIRQSGCEIRWGKRVLADRIKFDAWCSTQSVRQL